MAGESLFSGESTVIVDTNVFLSIGRPSNAKYVRFRREVQRTDTALKLPQRVVDELGGHETRSIKTALDEGWVVIIDAPDPEDGDAVAASDIARRTIANETGQPMHKVEKADTILAGLAIQYLRDRSAAGVIVLTDDIPAKTGIENAVEAQGYSDVVSVYGVHDVIGDDSDDSMTLI